jgi:hypothetical protein
VLLRDFQSYVDAASDNQEICIAIRSIETGEQIAASYDVVADISECGELIISTQIGTRSLNSCGVSEDRSIEIPEFILYQIIDLMGWWDVFDYESDFMRSVHYQVYRYLISKKYNANVNYDGLIEAGAQYLVHRFLGARDFDDHDNDDLPF